MSVIYEMYDSNTCQCHHRQCEPAGSLLYPDLEEVAVWKSTSPQSSTYSIKKQTHYYS